MILFLDSNILIYLIEGDISLATRVQQTIEKVFKTHSVLRIAISALTLLECRVVPLRKNDKAILQCYDDFFASESLQIVELSRSVLDIATQLRAFNGLKTPDALQAACCLSLDTQHIFLTGDKGLCNVKSMNILCLE